MASDRSVRRVMTPAGDPAWLVIGYDDVKGLLADPRMGRSHPHPERAARYANSAIFGGPMGSPADERNGDRWMRRLLAQSLSARRMERLRPRVQALVDDLLDAIVADPPPVDLHEALAFPLPALAICELLGVPSADRERFRR